MNGKNKRTRKRKKESETGECGSERHLKVLGQDYGAEAFHMLLYHNPLENCHISDVPASKNS